MPVKRRKAKHRRAEVPADVFALLSDYEGNHPVRFFLTESELRAAWNEVKDEILEAWAREEPGSRPFHWWQFEALELRRRLGGVGTPSHEVSAAAPWYEFGLPVCWVSKWEENYFNGRARHVDGHRIGTEYEEGHFAGLAIDAQDPPAFESEAAYLRRLNLLLPTEMERLTEADFEPETIGAEAEPDEAA